MERDIIDIVKDKEFAQLSAQERAELKDFCASEEEFVQLKSVFAAVDSMSAEDLAPRSETKEKLDALFHQTYPGAAPVWYNSLLAVAIPREKPLYRQPLVQIAAVVAVILMAIPLIDQDVSNEPELLADANTAEQAIEANEESFATEKSNGSGQADLESTDDNYTVSANSQAEVHATSNTGFAVGGSFSSAPGQPVLGSTASAGKHPDGVFDMEPSGLSVAASETPDVLDLLTTTF